MGVGVPDAQTRVAHGDERAGLFLIIVFSSNPIGRAIGVLESRSSSTSPPKKRYPPNEVAICRTRIRRSSRRRRNRPRQSALRLCIVLSLTRRRFQQCDEMPKYLLQFRQRGSTAPETHSPGVFPTKGSYEGPLLEFRPGLERRGSRPLKA